MLAVVVATTLTGCSGARSTGPNPSERLDAEIYLVEVSADGRTLDIYVDVCEQEADLSEFEETESEIRVRASRTAGEDLADCAISFTRELVEPLAGRPIVDLSTGEPVKRVTDLSS